MTTFEFIGVTAVWAVVTVSAAYVAVWLASVLTPRHYGLAGLAVLNLALLGTIGLGVLSWLLWIISMVVNHG